VVPDDAAKARRLAGQGEQRGMVVGHGPGRPAAQLVVGEGLGDAIPSAHSPAHAQELGLATAGWQEPFADDQCPAIQLGGDEDPAALWAGWPGLHPAVRVVGDRRQAQREGRRAGCGQAEQVDDAGLVGAGDRQPASLDERLGLVVVELDADQPLDCQPVVLAGPCSPTRSASASSAP
jgi:hypothetical protein